MASTEAHDINSQCTKIKEFEKQPLVKGDTWYLVSTNWWKQLKKYIGYDSWDTSVAGDETAHPGPIDNTDLFQENMNKIKEHLLEELDYRPVPEPLWRFLVQTYGTIHGQEAIGRRVIRHGMYVKQCKVEVYLMELNLCLKSDELNVVCQEFSGDDPVGDIDNKIRELFDVPDTISVKLYNKYMSNTYEPLARMEQTIQDAGLYHRQVIVMELLGTLPQSNAAKKCDAESKGAQGVKVSKSQTSKKAPDSDLHECSICLESLLDSGRDSRMLKCFHSFCSVCLDKLKKQQTIKCPVCKEETKVPNNDVNKLRQNFMFQKIKDLQKHNSEGKLCNICNIYPQLFKCEKCVQVICQKCKNKHDTIPSFRGHHVLPLSLLCEDHNREISHICEQCMQALCVKCMMIGHSEHADKFVEFSDGIRKIKSEFIEKVDNLKKVTADYHKRSKEELKKKQQFVTDWNELSREKNALAAKMSEIDTRMKELGKLSNKSELTIKKLNKKNSEDEQLVESMTKALDEDGLDFLMQLKNRKEALAKALKETI